MEGGNNVDCAQAIRMKFSTLSSLRKVVSERMQPLRRNCEFSGHFKAKKEQRFAQFFNILPISVFQLRIPMHSHLGLRTSIAFPCQTENLQNQVENFPINLRIFFIKLRIF